jgi:hypothetical protein
MKFVKENFEQFQRNFYSLPPELRCELWIKVALHLVPKAEEKTDEVQGYVLKVVDANDNPIGEINND